MLPQQLERGVGVFSPLPKQVPDTACRSAVVGQTGKQGFFAFAVLLPHQNDINHDVPLSSRRNARVAGQRFRR